MLLLKGKVVEIMFHIMRTFKDLNIKYHLLFLNIILGIKPYLVYGR